MPLVDFENCCEYVKPTVMPSIGCPVNWGQIVRIGFQEKQNTASFTSVADLVTQASWTALLAPATPPANNQILITPTSPDGKTGLYNFAIEPGSAITQGGGDSTTLGGLTINVGRNFSAVTAILYSVNSDLVKTITELLECGKNLSVYFVNTFGQIIAKKVTATTFEGFSIYSGFAQDRKVTGEFERDENQIMFMIEKGFSKNFYVSDSTLFANTMVNP